MMASNEDSAAVRAERRGRVLLTLIADAVDPEVAARLQQVAAPQVCAEVLGGTSSLRRAPAYRARAKALDVDAAIDQALSGLTAIGGRLLIPGDGEWPTALDDLDLRAPYALWVRGGFALAALHLASAVAIVGARAATQYGEHVATQIAADLAGRSWAIVSGGAYGIDAAAHRGAVVAGGPTVAVLANGVDQVYPQGNAQLLARVLERGAVVSELPPGRHPTRQGFLARNRIIAALAGGTLVVEAALRSGSASTVTRAVELGREVMAVPGPVTSAMSTGTHALLRDGATLVTGADDVVEAMGGLAMLADAANEPKATDRDQLGTQQLALLDAFPARATIDEVQLSLRSGLDVLTTTRVLGRLSLEGWVERQSNGWRLGERARLS